MGTCPKCGVETEFYYDIPCPDCNRIATQIAADGRAQRDLHLNEIKRKLLDLAMESLDDQQGSAEKAAVLMHSSDFRENLHWFWNDVSENTFLMNVYCEMTLAPLVSSSMSDNDSVSFFDGLDINVRGVAGRWLSSQTSDSAWRKVALEKFRKYEQVLNQRKLEQQIEAAESAKRNAQEQTARDKKRAIESAAQQRKETRQKILCMVAATFCSLLYLCGFLFGGFIKLPVWINANNYTALAGFCVLLLVALTRVFITSLEYAGNRLRRRTDPNAVIYTSSNPFGDVDSGKWLLYWCSVILALYLTSRYWGQIEGPARVAALAASFGVPFIPLIRGTIGSVAIGIASGLVSLPVAYVAGAVLSGIFAWIMTSGH